jgi:hypothetical protein
VVELYCKVRIGYHPRWEPTAAVWARWAGEEAAAVGAAAGVVCGPDGLEAALGLYPIATFQHSSTTLYQVSNHIQ